MDQELEKRFTQLEAKVDRIWKSVEQTRKINLWFTIITIALFVLPLIGLLFVLPSFIKSLNVSDLIQ